MAGETEDGRRFLGLKRAEALIAEALDLLDAHGGPPAAAANLEVALEEIRNDALRKRK